ncbi:beta-hexosaminidase [Parabacteroides sp. 52]|uniref:beta-N-acetylhexosaminidase n=1 Tax=unclassified Parabacteroides TaxID=2649774 RepID=UPI0013D34107|nr:MULTISPECIES: family 20 glycosylhydrolase [unclassified Parabacteroides]MDH6534103.1 hexosaminidase [Parabacteroides sp. PM5-20]NDV54994.1 beta-hexosaminidase [Parabacteroides sp. 52]
MNRLLFMMGCICLLMGGCSPFSSCPSVIPLPESMQTTTESFCFTPQTTIYIDQPEYQEVACHLSELFLSAAGFTLPISREASSGKRQAIYFETDPQMEKEHYELMVTPAGVKIKAAGSSGFFYAIQTIHQLLPPQIDSPEKREHIKWEIPALRINDGPRFDYRGLLLDASRFFVPKENVLKIIDQMAMLKLNKLHFHLVDGNGWRLEIKKHPRLTGVGAWRVEREGDFSQRRNGRPGEPTPVGGYYTQDDMREIVAYAAARAIEVIPEIEMPAHTNSSLAAYPELACPVVTDFIGVIPGLGGENHADEIVYCAGNEAVFTFLEEVIDEVIALFPSSYIHIGGDEASKNNWKKCPHCQARMQKEGLHRIEDLQGYFMNRIARYIRAKGKTVIGWDELTNSQLPEDAVILAWQGLGKAGHKAGKQGHRFIMTPARVLYFIRYQGPQWFEPRTYFGNITLKDVYDYEPVQPEWEEEVVENLWGVQACMWTEFINHPRDIEHQLFPRLAALAEVAWSGRQQKEWSHFLTRLDQLLLHYDQQGINYARSMFNIDHRATGDKNQVELSLSCIRPDMQIRYTTDESDPSPASPLYERPFLFQEKTIVRAATFANGQRKGEILTLPVLWNKATARPITGDNPHLYRLTNGLRGSDKHSDFEWNGWHGEDFSFTIDLQQPTSIETIRMGCITNYGMAVHPPRAIRISISEDDAQYRIITDKEWSDPEIFREGIHVHDQVFTDLHAEGRYIRFEITNPGKCPPHHVRPGQPTWVYLDEISID